LHNTNTGDNNMTEMTVLQWASAAAAAMLAAMAAAALRDILSR